MKPQKMSQEELEIRAKIAFKAIERQLDYDRRTTEIISIDINPYFFDFIGKMDGVTVLGHGRNQHPFMIIKFKDRLVMLSSC